MALRNPHARHGELMLPADCDCDTGGTALSGVCVCLAGIQSSQLSESDAPVVTATT